MKTKEGLIKVLKRHVIEKSKIIDFLFESGKNYYPQIFLEECKCKMKKKDKNHLLLMI